MWKRMRLMAAKVKVWRPRGPMPRQLAIGAGLLTLVVVAFFLGQKFAVSECQAQPSSTLYPLPGSPTSSGEWGQRVVAYIYGNVPITREELGEYLIARFGAERIEFLVNRRIVDMACKAQGVYVTDDEVEAQLKEELKAFGNLSLKDFENNILRRYNKTLFEWKEDVVRPKLMLGKLARPRVVVTEEDVRNAFDARYGDKVECRLIVLEKDNRHKDEIWQKVSTSEAEFDRAARQQFIQSLAAQAGRVPPIHKHFGDPRLEEAAFKLKDGEVSGCLQMPQPDGSWVILKRDKLIPAETTARLDADRRLILQKEVEDFKLALEVPKVFKELLHQAQVNILMPRPRVPQAEVERQVIQTGAVTPSGTAPAAPTPMPPPPPSNAPPAGPAHSAAPGLLGPMSSPSLQPAPQPR